MACCKAEEFGGWCKDHTIVYTNNYGDDYCLFHAPKGHKGISAESFNGKVLALIEAAIATDEECNLSGTVFPGTLRLMYGDSRPLPMINFSMVTFSGNTDFSHVIFNRDANFSNAVFSQEANFSNAIFRESAYFMGAMFNGLTYFSSYFMSAAFNIDADFSNATFSNEANFGHATFNNHAFFYLTTFNRANFSNASFKGIATFSRAIFNGVAVFENDKENIFQGGVLFTEVKVVSSTIFFIGVDFSNACFSLLETILANFRFDRCIWPRKKYSGLFAWLNNKMFRLFTSNDTEIFYDEIQAETKEGFCGGWSLKWRGMDSLTRYGVVEDLYCQMKAQYKERHNEAEVSKWHYREKEMFRKKNLFRRYIPLSATNLYWAFSGYGERPIRAGVILLLLFPMIGIVMNSLGFKAGGTVVIQGFSFFLDWAKIGLVIQAIIEHALFIKDPALKALTTGGAIILLLCTKILIPIQSALFAFALRNKFRR